MYTAPSTVPNAGRGLFASRSFEEGEIVTISPVLLLPVRNIDDGSGHDSSVLINYAMSIEEASVALLPFGMSGTANHAPSPLEKPMGSFTANMKPEWFYWDERMIPPSLQNNSDSNSDINSSNSSKPLSRPTSKTLLELSQLPFTQLGTHIPSQYTISSHFLSTHHPQTHQPTLTHSFISLNTHFITLSQYTLSVLRVNLKKII